MFRKENLGYLTLKKCLNVSLFDGLRTQKYLICALVSFSPRPVHQSIRFHPPSFSFFNYSLLVLCSPAIFLLPLAFPSLSDRGQRSPLPCLPHCHVDLALVISQVNIDPDDQCLPDTDLGADSKPIHLPLGFY